MRTIKYGIWGDVHGNYGWVKYSLQRFAQEHISTVIQVGDFGIWPESAKFLAMTQDLLKKHGITLFVVPGNHDDYDQINALPVNDSGWQILRPNIVVVPRGQRWEWEGTSFVALGGAPSVDRAYRKHEHELHPRNPPIWWAAEAITLEDVSKVAVGGYADVMIAHDAPNGVNEIEKQIGSNPHGFQAADILYAAEGRQLMDQAFHAVAPRIFIHGHYHFPVDEYVYVNRGGERENCHILGLNKDRTNYSLGEIDTTSKTAVAWDIYQDYQVWLARNRG